MTYGLRISDSMWVPSPGKQDTMVSLQLHGCCLQTCGVQKVGGLESLSHDLPRELTRLVVEFV